MKKALLIAPMSSVHERFNISNINALKEMNYEIHLAANFDSDEHSKAYKNKVRNDGIYVHEIPFERASLIANLRCIPDLNKLIKNTDFDIVHCHTETGGLLTSLSMSNKNNTHYIYTAHGMSFYKGSSLKSQLIYRPVERFICSKMDYNVAMNSEEYEVIKKWKPSSAKFIHGVGVDFERIIKANPDRREKCNELGIPIDRKILLSIGELNENKNHSVVIKALAKMPERERPFYLICGVGELDNYIQGLVNDLGLQNDVKLAGYRYDINEIVNISDLFIFPSFHEGLSVALMQAMSAGLPVIASKIRGNVDIVDDNAGGYLVEPTDVEAIKEKISLLSSDDSLCSSMGLHNQGKMNKYDLNSVKEENKKIYDIK